MGLTDRLVAGVQDRFSERLTGVTDRPVAGVQDNPQGDAGSVYNAHGGDQKWDLDARG